MLRCVLYVSTARSAITRSEVNDVVAESRRNNAAVGITGLLLFNGSNFMQLIEGAAGPLGALMRRLYADPRHDGLIKLVDRKIARASCSGWAMQGIGIGFPQPERGEVIANALPIDLADDLRTLIVGFARLN